MTIPASQIVQFNPSVISAGGDALDIIGLMLTQNTRVPIGGFEEFTSSLAVSEALGASSVDAAAAQIYFTGPNGATKLPAQMLVAQYNTVSVAAYLRSASLAAVSLLALQSFAGPINIVMDGYLRSATISLSGATSFSNAASIIQTGLNATPTTLATFTASILGGTMTVTGTLTGLIAIGQTVTGSNTAPGSIIVSQLTGGTVGGTGTYSLSKTSGSVTSQSLSTIPTALTVSFDSVTSAFVIQSGLTGTLSTAAYASGSFATQVSLTQALGAVLSQGAAPATPAAFMANIIRQTTDWATFFLNFDVDGGSGNANKQLFSQWVATTNKRYAYLAGDADITPTQSIPASASLGQIVFTENLDGTIPIYDPNIYPIAAFVAGCAASINFNQTNGRITFAFKWQDGLTPTVTDPVVAQNLLGNNYSFGGAYATANNGFEFFYDGAVSGQFLWLDSYINQIWLNAQMQLALMELLTQVNSIPFTNAGFSLVKSALASIIQQGLAFGAYSPGVSLSSEQAVAVNAQAGANIAQTLQTQGWYLQVKDPGAAVRETRGSPICFFWYVDGESVQQITFSSVAVL